MMKLNAIALMVALGLTSSAVVDAFVVPNSNSHPNYALRQRTATVLAASKGKGNIQSQGQSMGGESNSRLYASTTIDTMSSLPNYGSDSRSANVQSGKDDSAQDVKVGVLLLNLGGPEKTEDVEGFLYNLFADPDIIRLPKPLSPLQKTIALIISKRRAPKSIAAYESIGGGSPILKYSNEQADLVKQSLSTRYGVDVETYIGMRYWYPFTEEALEEIRKDGVNALVIVPLYPQFSISTSGSSLRVLQEEFARNSDVWGGTKTPFTHTVVPSWYDRPGYTKAMADIIQKELDSFTQEEIDAQLQTNPIGKHILFSAHGVPQSYIAAGDPYQEQIRQCVQKISELLPSEEEGVKVHLSYQSRVGPIEWLRPYTDDVLPELGQDGVKNLVVVPISFVSEHIETLEEIDIEYRELAEENGICNWRRAQALNTDMTFIDDMADMIVEALSQPSLSVTEACVANNVGLVDLDDAEELSSAGVGGVGYSDELTSQMRLKADERFYGRMAIIAVIGSIFIEMLSGKNVSNLFGF
jgi:ferrochelatase